MDKVTFLKRLDERLRFLAENERKDILYDYEEHINAALENGESEEDIIQKLGNPEIIARQFSSGRVEKRADVNSAGSNSLRAVLVAIGLGFFNLVFVLGIFLGLVGTLFGFYGIACSFAFGGLVTAGVGVFGLLGGSLELFIHTAGTFTYNPEVFSVGLIGIGICIGSIGGLIGIGSIWLTKWFYKGTVAYLKLNVQLIKGEPIGTQR